MMPARSGSVQSYGEWAKANPTNPDAAAYLAARENALSAIPDTFPSAPREPAQEAITLPRYGVFELDERARLIENSLRAQDAAGVAAERARKLAEATASMRTTPGAMARTADYDPEQESRRSVALNGMRVAKAQAELDAQNSGSRPLVLSITDLPPDEPPNPDRDAVRRRHENTDLIEFYGVRARQLMSTAEYEQASLFLPLGRKAVVDGELVPAGPSNPPFGN